MCLLHVSTPGCCSQLLQVEYILGFTWNDHSVLCFAVYCSSCTPLNSMLFIIAAEESKKKQKTPTTLICSICISQLTDNWIAMKKTSFI